MEMNSEIKVERKDDDDDQLMIDDEEFVDEMNIEDPTDDTNDDQVRLEKLPRPVNDLNCRQARTYLVKLLRAANGGQNPHYGNPESKPPFWPDYYWPWEKLFDVHTKPRGMNEPLQYSEMMKLAIGRGYQYFGYDPNTYVRAEGEASFESDPLQAAEPIVNISEEPFIESDEFESSKFYLKQPPRLPRPLTKVNCVQARTALAKLLRYQQCGNNPVYGSPDTEPPWWPNNLIRWVDMVDLRGKPPYLPDTKSYTDVLKIAIANAYAYYGYDPECFLDIYTDPNVGLLGPKQKMFPVIPAAGIAPPPPPKAINSSYNVSYTSGPGVTSHVVRQSPPPQIEHIPPKLQGLISKDNINLGNNPNDDDDDEEMGELPAKLPMPVGKMNCSVTRTCLARLIRFHCGRGQLPNYGNPASMPVWWPNHIIDWTRIKNLSHRYEGYLGNTYSNCLRIAMIRGYAHYGLDANEYVERKGVRDPYQPLHTNSPLALEASLAFNGKTMQQDKLVAAPVQAQPIVVNGQPQQQQPQQHQQVNSSVNKGMRPLPSLVPLNSLVSDGQYPQSLLDTRDWFPPRLAYSKAIDASPDAIKLLKPCKVIVDSTFATKNERFSVGAVKEEKRIADMLKFFRDDLEKQKFTDITLVADKKSPSHPKENFSVKVHRLVLAAHSYSLRVIMQDLNDDDPCLVLSGVTGATLTLLVEALYSGKVTLTSKNQLKQFESALTCLNSFGILLNLRPVVSFEMDGSSELIDDPEHDKKDEDQEEPKENEDVVEEEKNEEENEEEPMEEEELLKEDEPLKKKEKTPEPEKTPPTRSRRTRKEQPKEEPQPVEEKPIVEKTGKKRTRTEEPVVVEEETMKRRRRTDKTKEEANKPLFDNVTTEILNAKMEEGQKTFIEWLQNEGFLRKTPPTCAAKDCQSKLQLETQEEDVDGVVWKCPKGKDHATISVREGSIFGRVKKSGTSDSLSWIIQIILCWSDNTSLVQCQQLTGADVEKIFFWYDECRDYYGTL